MRIRRGSWVVAAVSVVTLSWTEARAQVRAGAQFRVNTYTTQGQARPAIAAEKDGDFVAVWQSLGQEGDACCPGVFGQRYDRSGARRGAEFRVNTYTSGDQYLPQAAVSPAGSFVVVWNSLRQDGSGTGVSGQRFDAAGDPAGAEFHVNTYTTGYQNYAQVAMDARGSFMVVWQSWMQDGDARGIYARRYDPSGNALGAEFRVNTYTTSSQQTPRLAMRASGEAVVVWDSEQDGSLSGVYARRYDAAGNPMGAEFRVNSYTTSYQLGPNVGMADDGRFVVLWESIFPAPNSRDIRGQRFGADGTPEGAEFAAVTATGGQYIYGVAVDHQANFVVTWDHNGLDGSDWGVFARRFSSAGAPRGAQFLVNTYTSGYQGFGIGAPDEVGNFVVAWFDGGLDGSEGGVFAQRHGGLFTVALAVDTGGNGVWEPGEIANVVPTWRNLNGAAQTFGGALSGLTGPAGATYTIPDGTAAYGTLANDASAPCTDCYAVAVDDASPRPVQHWDASALESITPDVQGQQKRWTLHVGRSFTDVPDTNPFYRFIETLLHFGITGGCGGSSYCPSSSTTREQMAVFVLIAREGAGYLPPACSPPNVFADVPETSPFCPFIEELSNRGVVGGCGPGPAYCPAAAVTREQMAVFVLRTLEGPSYVPPACAAPNVYNDVPETSPFCSWIEELSDRGVVGGCGGGNYCPTGPVTREQMGVFISGTFGLSLYGL